MPMFPVPSASWLSLVLALGAPWRGLPFLLGTVNNYLSSTALPICLPNSTHISVGALDANTVEGRSPAQPVDKEAAARRQHL